MKINRVDSEIIRDDHHQVLATSLARTHNSSRGPFSSVVRVGKVSRQTHHSSFRIQDHHSSTKKMRPRTVVRVTIRPATNNIHSTKMNPMELADILSPKARISTARDHQNKSRRAATRREKKTAGRIYTSPILSSFPTIVGNTAKSIVSQSFVEASNSEAEPITDTK